MVANIKSLGTSLSEVNCEKKLVYSFCQLPVTYLFKMTSFGFSEPNFFKLWKKHDWVIYCGKKYWFLQISKTFSRRWKDWFSQFIFTILIYPESAETADLRQIADILLDPQLIIFSIMSENILRSYFIWYNMYLKLSLFIWG